MLLISFAIEKRIARLYYYSKPLLEILCQMIRTLLIRVPAGTPIL